MGKKKVFAVVVNYNGKETLLSALKSLLASSYTLLDVVVVDNGSTDGSLELAKETFPRAHYIVSGKNRGFAVGANLGIRYALEKMADAVFLLNSDAIVEKQTISRLMKTILTYGPGLYSASIYSPNMKPWFIQGRIDWNRLRATHVSTKEKGVISSEYVTGCALMIDKAVCNRVGVFDEQFFLYYEDVDFSMRAKKANFPVSVVSNALVYHQEVSEQRPAQKTYHLVRSGDRFFRKHMPLWRRPWYWGARVARLFRSARRRRLFPGDHTKEAVFRGLRDLPYESHKS